MLRSHLFAGYRKRIGALESVPELRADAATITRFNLPSDAGFVLSLVDGATSVADMLSVSGLDPFDTLRILEGLLQVEILSMRALRSAAPHCGLAGDLPFGATALAGVSQAGCAGRR